MSFKIFLLYSNEDISEYEHPDIIPIKLNQTLFFESEFFRMIQIDDIPQVDTLGIITPAFSKKSTISFQDLLELCKTKPKQIKGFIQWATPIQDLLDYSVGAHGTNFLIVWNWLLYSLSLSYTKGCPGFFANTWIGPRDLFLEYVKIAKQAIESMENAPQYIQDKLHSNAGYKTPSKETQDNILKRDYYTYHCFLMERLICVFAHAKGLKLSSNSKVDGPDSQSPL